MKILLIHFSHTGNVRRVAELVFAALEGQGEVTVAEIKPRRTHSYWFWLALSFVAGSRVAICETVLDVRAFDLVFLGIPKWTLSCPPVNQYLRTLRNCRGKPFAVWVCHGGFDGHRYLRGFLSRLLRMEIAPVAWQLIKRREIREGTCLSEVAAFCREALIAVRNRSEC